MDVSNASGSPQRVTVSGPFDAPFTYVVIDEVDNGPCGTAECAGRALRTNADPPSNVRVVEVVHRLAAAADRVVHEHRDPTFVPDKAGDGPAESRRRSGSGGKKTRRKKKNIVGSGNAEPASDEPGSAAAAERRMAERREAERLAELGRYKNSTVVLVCVDERRDRERVLQPTRDPYDSAHGRTEGNGPAAMLVPNATVDQCKTIRAAGAVPRRYPAEQLNSRGVSLDSVFDATYEAQRELDGIPGIGIQDNRRTVGTGRAVLVEKMVLSLGVRGADDVIHQRTRQAKIRIP